MAQSRPKQQRMQDLLGHLAPKQTRQMPVDHVKLARRTH